VLGTQGTVTLSEAASGDLTVNLSSNNSIVSVPATVTVLNAQSTAGFSITVNDDGVYTGTRTVTITASASGYSSGTDSIAIADDDTPVTVSLPATAQEGDGIITDGGTVSVPSPVSSNLTVSLTSDDTGELIVPSSVIILSGSASASFDLTVVNDGVTDANITVTVTASAAGYADGSDTMVIEDIDYVAPEPDPSGTKGGCTPGGDQPPVVLVLVLVLVLRLLVKHNSPSSP
jgi:hypothetical protein